MSNEKIHGKYDVWDWIVDKNGKVRQITHDDMQDLKYEEIARHAEPEEVELKRAFPFNGYAPGHYTCYCNRCKKDFMGDKRAFTCLKCAVEISSAPAAPESRGGEGDETFVDADLKKQSIPSLEEIEEMQKAQDGLCKMAGGENTPELAFTSGANWMRDRMLRYFAAERQRGEGIVKWKEAHEFAPFHPSASHIPPDYRDGWNHCYALASALLDKAREENLSEFFKWLEKSEFRYDYGRFYTETYANRTSETKFFTHEHVFAAFLAGKEGKNV